MNHPKTKIKRRAFLAAGATLAGLGMTPLAISGPVESRMDPLATARPTNPRSSREKHFCRQHKGT